MEKNQNIGKRIKLIEMGSDEPNPVPPGTMGTIYHYGYGVYNVNWDNGRTLGVDEFADRFIIYQNDPPINGNNQLYFSGNY